MVHRLTQQEAEQKALENGFKLISDFKSTKTKATFKCGYCGNDYFASPGMVFSGVAKSCGCQRYKKNTYSYEEAKQKIEEKGFLLLTKESDYINLYNDILCKCPVCLNDFVTKGYKIVSQDLKSCGCLWKSKYRTLDDILNKCKEQNVELLDSYIKNTDRRTSKRKM